MAEQQQRSFKTGDKVRIKPDMVFHTFTVWPGRIEVSTTPGRHQCSFMANVPPEWVELVEDETLEDS